MWIKTPEIACGTMINVACVLRFIFFIDFFYILFDILVPGGCRGIGSWLLKILAEFYKADEDEEEGEDGEQSGGSQRGAFIILPHVILDDTNCCN